MKVVSPPRFPASSPSPSHCCLSLRMDSFNKSKNRPPITQDHPLMQRFKKMCPGRDPKDGVFLQISELAPSPRTIKSHLPLSLLPQNLLTTSKVT